MILGGAGLIGIASIIQQLLPVQIVCSNEAGLRATAKALAAGEKRHQTGTGQVETVGLSDELTEMFRLGQLIR